MNVTDKNKVDEYSNIKKVTRNTMEGLILFLGIPDS